MQMKGKFSFIGALPLIIFLLRFHVHSALMTKSSSRYRLLMLFSKGFLTAFILSKISRHMAILA